MDLDFVASLRAPDLPSIHRVQDRRRFNPSRQRFAGRTLPAIACTAGLLAGTLAADPWPRHIIDASSQGADGVRLGDLDRDGRPDVVTGWEEGGAVRVCFNPGPDLAGRPWPAVTVGQAPSVEDAVFVDLNGDGILEVVSCSEGSARRMQIHEWNDLRPDQNDLPTCAELLDEQAWRTRTIPVADGRAMWMFALPWAGPRGSGPGLIAGAKGDGASISRLWLAAGGDPDRAWRMRPLRAAGWIMTLTAADLDGDGDPDLVFSDRKGAGRGVAWLENSGAQPATAGTREAGTSGANHRASWPEHPILTADQDVMFIDLRQDPSVAGDWWFAAAVKPRTLIVSRCANPAGGRWTEMARVTLPEAFGTTKAVRFADLDDDGRWDLVFTCEDATGPRSGAGWFPGLEQRPARFDTPRDIAGPEGVKYDLIELLDLDGDGDTDVLTCEERDNLGVLWYENPMRQPRESGTRDLPGARP